jgi:predicted nuclease of predicted toxin-antitoxin system
VRILADENFPGLAVEPLRLRGHDVVWIRMDSPGADDRDVLARAVIENRLLVTFDKDFGELAFRARLPTKPGIVLFRIPPVSPSRVAQVAATVLESRHDWEGHFSVVEPDRLRLVPLP